MISIIIVNYNTEAYIKKCVKSIISNYELRKTEIIIVDNGSSNGKLEEVLSEYEGLNIIYLPENNGFGAGCNLGVKYATKEYLLFLNPDIIVTKNSIEYLLETITGDKNIGVCAGILLDENNKVLYSYNNFPDLKWEFKEAFDIGLKNTINKLTSREEIKKEIPFEVDWFHGACMLMRKDLFEEVGGFDENIFLYYEDVDIHKKIKGKGYKIVCIPKSKFYHYERSSVRESGFSKVYYYYMNKSKLYYHNIYSGKGKVLLIRLMFIYGSIFKFISLIFRPNKWIEIPNRIKQYLLTIGIHLNIIRNI